VRKRGEILQEPALKGKRSDPGGLKNEGEKDNLGRAVKLQGRESARRSGERSGAQKKKKKGQQQSAWQSLPREKARLRRLAEKEALWLFARRDSVKENSARRKALRDLPWPRVERGGAILARAEKLSGKKGERYLRKRSGQKSEIGSC